MALPSITPQDIDEVLRYAPAVGALTAVAGPLGGQPGLLALLAAMDATGFTAPFDWQSEFADRRADLESASMVDGADLEMLRKLMTAHVRIDRYDPGHLDALIRSGYWSRCLQRLQQLRAQR